jgi:hypothetical protein
MGQKEKRLLLRTAGWCTIAVGMYMIYKGTDPKEFVKDDDIIEAEVLKVEIVD